MLRLFLPPLLTVLLASCGGETERRSQHLLVEAVLVAQSEVPTADDVAPYREGLFVCEYDILEVIEGHYEPETLRVSHWGVAGGKPQEFPLEIGETTRLELTPLSELPGLQDLYVRDDLDFLTDPEIGSFLDLSQSLDIETPTQVRHHYRGLLSWRMPAFWQLRSQLRLVILGTSHSGVAVSAREFLQPENQLAPLAYNLSLHGSGLNYQLLFLEDYLGDLPELEWLVWCVSPRLFNAHHIADREFDEFLASPGRRYDEKHRHQLWPTPALQETVPVGQVVPPADTRLDPWGWTPLDRPRFHQPLSDSDRASILADCQRVEFEWNQVGWDAFTAAVRSLRHRGVKVLLFTPPTHPVCREAKAIDPDWTDATSARHCIHQLTHLAESDDGILFTDFLLADPSPFVHEDFRDIDHLRISGARKLTRRLVEKVEEAR